MSGSPTFARQAVLTLLERNLAEWERVKYLYSTRIVFRPTMPDYLSAHEAKRYDGAASEVPFSDLAMGLVIYVEKEAVLLRSPPDLNLGLSRPGPH